MLLWCIASFLIGIVAGAFLTVTIACCVVSGRLDPMNSSYWED